MIITKCHLRATPSLGSIDCWRYERQNVAEGECLDYISLGGRQELKGFKMRPQQWEDGKQGRRRGKRKFQSFELQGLGTDGALNSNKEVMGRGRLQCTKGRPLVWRLVLWLGYPWWGRPAGWLESQGTWPRVSRTTFGTCRIPWCCIAGPY